MFAWKIVLGIKQFRKIVLRPIKNRLKNNLSEIIQKILGLDLSTMWHWFLPYLSIQGTSRVKVYLKLVTKTLQLKSLKSKTMVSQVTF